MGCSLTFVEFLSRHSPNLKIINIMKEGSINAFIVSQIILQLKTTCPWAEVQYFEDEIIECLWSSSIARVMSTSHCFGEAKLFQLSGNKKNCFFSFYANLKSFTMINAEIETNYFMSVFFTCIFSFMGRHCVYAYYLGLSLN